MKKKMYIKRILAILLTVSLILGMQGMNTLMVLADNTSVSEEVRIYSAKEFKQFAQSVQDGTDYANQVVYLEDDIDLENSEDNQTVMVGYQFSYSNIKSFAGTFDGQGHTISGIYIKDESTGYKGLFGKVTGVVKNLTVKGEVTGKLLVGGIAYQCSGTIENCMSYVNVSSVGNQTAGIVGNLLKNGIVKNCINYGNINSTVASNGSTGGIVGSTQTPSQIIGCANIGKIQAKATNVGGIVASASATTTIIKNCYNMGEVSTQNNNASVGGILGNGACSMSNCYNVGTISGPNGSSALLGFQNQTKDSIIDNCYYLDGSADYAISNPLSVDKNLGKTDSTTMKTEDFVKKLNQNDTIYCKDMGINQGYPIFIWQNSSDVPVLKNVTFISDGKTYKNISVVSGTCVTRPTDPEKSGCTLKYWSLSNDENAKEYSFDTPVTENITLYAIWDEGLPVYEDWDYEVIADGREVKLTKYKGSTTSVVTPETLASLPVTTIGNQAFSKNTNITNVILTDNIVKVEDGTGLTSGAFSGCSNLQKITLSKNLEKIADYMFYGIASAHDYALSIDFASVKEIGEYAFACCNNIVTLTLPKTVTKIGYGAFYQARRLKTLNMPGVNEIQADAFTETIFEEKYEELWEAGEFSGIVYAGKVAYMYFGDDPDTKKMKKNAQLQIEDGTLGISEFIFVNHFVEQDSCKENLKSLTIPDTVEFIPEKLFDGFVGVNIKGLTGSISEDYAKKYENLQFTALNENKEYDWSKADYDWYDHSTSNTYVIHTADELRAFSDLLSLGTNFVGKTVKLAKDIDLGGLTKENYGILGFEWDIMDSGTSFAGTFDGDGHVISGVYMNKQMDKVAFFGTLSSTAVVKNLTIKGKLIGRDEVGTIAGYTDKGAVIEHCSFEGTVKGNSVYGYVGGIVGNAKQSTISNCTAYGEVICQLSELNNWTQQGYVGGIVGYNYGSTITNCENHAKVDSNGYGTGGIAGCSSLASVENSTNLGNVYGLENTGGISGKNMKALINGCRNEGEITSDLKAGGMVGFSVGVDGKMRSVVNSINIGKVFAKNHAAGIIGYAHDSTVSECNNLGEIKSSISYAAGIIGYGLGARVNDSYNLGAITAESYAAGISGFDGDAEGTLTNCYNIGIITAQKNVDDISNVYQNKQNTKNCYYLVTEININEGKTGKTENEFKSGEVTLLLGDKYGQLLGEDFYPVFRTEKNEVKKLCQGYYNGELTQEIKERCHIWDTGVNNGKGTITYTCTKCGTKNIKKVPVKSLATPKLISAKNESSGITINWKKVSDAKGYTVYRKTLTSKWTKISTITSASKVRYTDKKAKEGSTYIYTVRAYNDEVVSSYDKTGIKVIRLEVPKSILVKNESLGINIAWKKVTGAKGYTVYRKESKTKWTKIATIKGASKVSYTDKKVKNGKEYTYTVAAYNGNITSIYNTTGKKIAYLTAPKLNKLTNISTKKMNIKWKANKKASGYQIQYSTNSKFKKIVQVKIKSRKTVEKTISKLKKNQTYYVRIRAYKNIGKTMYYSTWSNTKKIKLTK